MALLKGDSVRILSIVTVAGVAAMAMAQQPSQQRAQLPEITFTSAADVIAMVAKAKNERKPDQPNFIQPLLKLAPYTVNLEYRVEGIDTPATVHEKEAELMYVVDGAATLTTGGKLAGEKRTNATNLSGTAVEGGTPRRISKGDYIFVPENTPHSFTRTQGSLVIMSIHVPRPASAG
jgi:mannose-6-phosphate isomerase-like protein (cupin superfamily)